MFVKNIAGSIRELSPNDQTRFQCDLSLTVPLDQLRRVEPGTLVAAENVFSTPKDKRYTVLVLVHSFPVEADEKPSKNSLTLACTAVPIGIEVMEGTKKDPEIIAADVFPAFEAEVNVLDTDTTQAVIHQIAPESRTEENGSRIDIGTYGTNPDVRVGLDGASLLRGNAAIISARPRARTTITNDLITALLANTNQPVHVVYCDVNNQGTLSLVHLLQYMEGAGILCLNDKFVPASVYYSMKNQGDRQAHKRAALDFLDMMILPSVLEQRRHDFVYGISQILRNNRISIYRANEQTVDQFINDIRIDILDGLEEDASELLTGLMNSIAETYTSERFNDTNTRDILEMIEEFSADSKNHVARRAMFDLRSEVQAVYESYSKDIPGAARKTISDVVHQLNEENSTLTVVQGRKTTDIMRFTMSLLHALIDERLKRLKLRIPVLLIFNNVDEYLMTETGAFRESGRERFFEIIHYILSNGRRHGIGFCLTLESASSMDQDLASKIQTYFVGPVTFHDEPHLIADLMNVSELLVRPAAHYEDGRFLFASSDSPYHRRVPLLVTTERNTDILHTYLDQLVKEQERRRQEYLSMDEERRKKHEEERRRRDTEGKKPMTDVEAAKSSRRPVTEDDFTDLETFEAGEESTVNDGSATSQDGKEDMPRRESRRQKAARKRAEHHSSPRPATVEPSEIGDESDIESSLTFTIVRSGGYDIDDEPTLAKTETTDKETEPVVGEEKKKAPAKRTRRPRRQPKKKEE